MGDAQKHLYAVAQKGLICVMYHLYMANGSDVTPTALKISAVTEWSRLEGMH